MSLLAALRYPDGAPASLRPGILPARQLWRLSAWVAGLTLALLWVFVQYPELDLALSTRLIDPHTGRFPHIDHPALKALYESVFWCVRSVVVVCVAALGWYLWKRRPLPLWRTKGWQIGPRVAAYLLVALISGPGLLINSGIKNLSGRARPRELDVFGGAHPYSAPLDWVDHCVRNCSFVSGHTAAAFFMLAVALLCPPRWRTAAVLASLAYGVLISAGRILQGAHFLSDTVFAALLTILTTLICYALLISPLASPTPTTPQP